MSMCRTTSSRCILELVPAVEGWPAHSSSHRSSAPLHAPPGRRTLAPALHPPLRPHRGTTERASSSPRHTTKAGGCREPKRWRAALPWSPQTTAACGPTPRTARPPSPAAPGSAPLGAPASLPASPSSPASPPSPAPSGAPLPHRATTCAIPRRSGFLTRPTCHQPCPAAAGLIPAQPARASPVSIPRHSPSSGRDRFHTGPLSPAGQTE
jgi:hypothetical protein